MSERMRIIIDRWFLRNLRFFGGDGWVDWADGNSEILELEFGRQDCSFSVWICS
jgi:hypothetical protein